MNARVVCACAAVLAGITVPAHSQQILNGGFEQGPGVWTNFPITSPPEAGWAVIDRGGDKELALPATNLFNQYQGVLFVQDLPAEYMDLDYGVALAADVAASNLSSDIRAFTKIEFGTNLNNVSASVAFSTEGLEYGPPTGSQSRVQLTRVVLHRELTNTLAGAGLKQSDLAWMRAVLFLMRFDTNKTSPTGWAYFDNASFGLVSRSYDLPGIINGGFEYENWGWGENSDKHTPLGGSNAFVRDVDADGDRELQFYDWGQVSKWDGGRIWVQEVDAKMIDFTPGVGFQVDIAASNLNEGFRAFSKLEFFIGAPPYGPGTNVFYLTGEGNPALHAMTNDTRINATLWVDYATLTNELHNASPPRSIDEITFLRAVLFLMPFADSPVPHGGWAAFDNARLLFSFKDRPDPTATQLAADGVKLTWDSRTNYTYRIQWIDDLDDYRWNTVVSGIPGGASSTSWTNPPSGDIGFLRVVRD